MYFRIKLSVIFLFVFLTLAMVVNSIADTRMRVTFINPGKSDEVFWAMVSAAMIASAEDLDVDLEVLYAERDRFRMKTLGNEVAARSNPPQYLIVVNEEQSAEEMVLAADRAGIKTFLLLNDFIGDQRKRMGEPRSLYDNWLGSITPDNGDAGLRMAQAIIQKAVQKHKADANGKFHLLAIGGDKVTPASIERNSGVYKALNQHPEVVLDRMVFANWNMKEAEKVTSRYLEWSQRNNIQPSAIWAANDPIAVGAVRALRSHNLEPGQDVFVSGLNWSKQGLAMVEAGEMVLTDGGHFLAGAWALVLLRDYHDGIDFASEGARVRFQMAAIDVNNIGEYKKHLGDETWSKIDFSRFSRARNPALKNYEFSLGPILRQFKE